MFALTSGTPPFTTSNIDKNIHSIHTLTFPPDSPFYYTGLVTQTSWRNTSWRFLLLHDLWSQNSRSFKSSSIYIQQTKCQAHHREDGEEEDNTLGFMDIFVYMVVLLLDRRDAVWDNSVWVHKPHHDGRFLIIFSAKKKKRLLSSIFCKDHLKTSSFHRGKVSADPVCENSSFKRSSFSLSLLSPFPLSPFPHCGVCVTCLLSWSACGVKHAFTLSCTQRDDCPRNTALQHTHASLQLYWHIDQSVKSDDINVPLGK